MPIILKHDITRVFTDDHVIIEGPAEHDARPLHVDWQGDTLCLWTQYTLMVNHRSRYEITGYVTGIAFHPLGRVYLTTVTRDGIVLHVFYRRLP